jgi:hypothetical protein
VIVPPWPFECAYRAKKPISYERAKSPEKPIFGERAVRSTPAFSGQSGAIMLH